MIGPKDETLRLFAKPIPRFSGEHWGRFEVDLLSLDGEQALENKQQGRQSSINIWIMIVHAMCRSNEGR